MYLLLFLPPGQCKAGRAPFLGPPGKSATCLAQGGRAFPEVGKFHKSPKTPHFFGLRFKRNSVNLENLRPALRKVGHTLKGSLLDKLRPALRLREPKKSKKIKVIRIKFSILENVPTPCGSILSLFGGKSKNIENDLKQSLHVFPHIFRLAVATPAWYFS